MVGFASRPRMTVGVVSWWGVLTVACVMGCSNKQSPGLASMDMDMDAAARRITDAGPTNEDHDEIVDSGQRDATRADPVGSTDEPDAGDQGDPVLPDGPAPKPAPIVLRDAAIPEPELFVDYFMQPCSDSELCLRTSMDARTWGTDAIVEWDGFEWGHRYRLSFHEEISDGAPTRLIVDEVLQDDAVEAGTRFSLTVTPPTTQADAGAQSFVVLTAQREGMLGDRGVFDCAAMTCDSIQDALAGTLEFELVFEFDETTQMHLVSVGQQIVDDGDLDRVAETWLAAQPEQFVVRVCTTGDAEYHCTLASVADGRVIEAKSQGLDGVWTDATLTQSPIQDVFDFVEGDIAAREPGCKTTYVVADEYSYLSEATTACAQETTGLQVTCFEPDTLDPATCSG